MVSLTEQATISAPELERVLQSVDPRVVLVPPRLLRRVIKRVGGVPGLGLQVPHRKSFVCAAADYTRVVEAGEGSGNAGVSLPETVILLEHPSPGALATV